MKKFNFHIDASLEKADTDEFFDVSGICSTNDRDLQNEIVSQEGLDISSLLSVGYVNDNHGQHYKIKKQAEMGIIKEAKITKAGLHVNARIFKNHPSAKVYYNEMKHGAPGRVKFSVEGRVDKRDWLDPKKVTKATVYGVALTNKPVNTFTYANLVKSLTSPVENDEFFTEDLEPQVTFTTDQVTALMKTLGITQAYGSTPAAELTGGSAMQTENLDRKKKKKKKLRTKSKEECQKKIEKALTKLQIQFPQETRENLWENLQNKIKDDYFSEN